MYEYDCAILLDTGDGFNCSENTVITETLSAADEATLNDDGFLIRTVSATEVHLIVNRMDVESLQLASDKFWQE